MTANKPPNRFKKPITWASLFTIVGLITALMYMWVPVHSRYNALSMVIFLMGGVPLMLVAIGIFFYAWRVDVTTRLRAWETERFEPGQIIFKEGDLGDRVYVIVNGEVEVVKNGGVLAKLGPRQYFGEMALLTNRPRNATVRAASELEVVSMGAEQFNALANLPSIREAFDKLIAERLGKPPAPLKSAAHGYE